MWARTVALKTNLTTDYEFSRFRPSAGARLPAVYISRSGGYLVTMALSAIS